MIMRMRLAREPALLLAAALAFGCSSGDPQPSPDAGPVADAAFQGETSGGQIPEFPGGLFDAGFIDAGEIVVDGACCNTTYRIAAGEEPEDATGLLMGDHPVFGRGLELTRGEGAWTARVCFPVNQSANYWFAFRWSNGMVDAGTVDLEDGGTESRTFEEILGVERASEDAARQVLADGRVVNFQPAWASCEAEGAHPP